MTRSKLLALKDHVTEEIQVINRTFGIKKNGGSRGSAWRQRTAARHPELWAKRVALIEQLADINRQLTSTQRLNIRTATISPIQSRPPRPALSIEPTPTLKFARPEGPRVPQHLYTKTVRKHRDRYLVH